MARLNLGECCDGEAGMYTYPFPAAPAVVNTPTTAGMYTYPLTASPMPQGRIVGPVQPVGQIQPAQTPAIPSQVMPAPTTMTMPGMVTTAQLTSPNPQPDLTPRDLIKPLPSIVDNQPSQIAQCNSFSDWVDQNPLLAGGMLLGLAWLVFGGKG